MRSQKTERLLDDCRRLKLRSRDLLREAENINKFGDWAYMRLLGYSEDDVREAAVILKMREAKQAV